VRVLPARLSDIGTLAASGPISGGQVTTTTRTGLKVYAQLDEREYPRDVKVTDEQLAAVNLTGDGFHPEWNYRIKPHS